MKTLTRSFAGGEITPELFGRLDLAKFQIGLAKALNFEILPHGPANNRAGFEYVLETKFSAKHSVLLPFSFNTQQTFQLEFGDQYVRFHTLGGTLLEAAKVITGISAANPGKVTSVAHGFNNGEWVFLSGILGPVTLNARYAIVANKTVNDFDLTDLAGNNINTTALPAYVAGGTTSRVFEVATPYLEAHLFDLHFVQSADVLTITHPTYQQRELRRLSATNWTLTAFTMAPVQAAPTVLVLTPSGAGAENNGYIVTAIATDGLEESLASIAVSGNGVALATASAFNTITWTNAANAVRYNVYKRKNGLYGYIGQALTGVVVGFKDDNITPDMSRTPPEGADPFVGAGNFPAAVSYYEQRRLFAGTDSKPQNIWMTRSATESNLTYSIPTRDDDSIAFRIAARQSNRIRHILPLADLILLTDGGAWRVTSVNSDAITPSSISVKPQSTIGASNVQPVIANDAILYAQARGGRLREMRINSNLTVSTVYTSVDASILAPHLVDGYTITSMCFSATPNTQWWGTRSDGLLLGLTYVPEHEVLAWHQHDTQGLFESVCATAEGNEDAVYAIIQRTIKGRTVRYVERKHSRQFTELNECFFVDAGLTYSGAAAMSITGLWHLEGATVSILVDGAEHPQRVVTNGSVALDYEGSVVVIGLAYNSDLQTLPLALQAQAFGQGTQKNVNKVYMRLNKSSRVFVGPAFDKLTELKQRTSEPYGTPPALISDELPLDISPKWASSGEVCLRQSQPLPVTLVSLTLDVALGG